MFSVHGVFKNQEQDMNRNNKNEKDGYTPLWAVFASKAANTSRTTKIAVTATALVILGLIRLSSLQTETGTQPSESLGNPASSEINSAGQQQHEERIQNAHNNIVNYELPPAQTPEQMIVPATNMSEPSANDQESVPTWLVLAMLGLAIWGGKTLASWTEKNGYDMKRFEDWANRRSRQRKDDPEP